VKSVEPTSPRRQSQHEQRRQSSCQLVSTARSKYLSVIARPHPAHSSACLTLTTSPLAAPTDDEAAAAAGGGGAGDKVLVDVTASLAVVHGDVTDAAVAFSVIPAVDGDFRPATETRLNSTPAVSPQFPRNFLVASR